MRDRSRKAERAGPGDYPPAGAIRGDGALRGVAQDAIGLPGCGRANSLADSNPEAATGPPGEADPKSCATGGARDLDQKNRPASLAERSEAVCGEPETDFYHPESSTGTGMGRRGGIVV